MVTLEFLMAACLDPVQAALVLAVVIVYRGPLPIVLSGSAAALITETIMMLAAPGYVWGELIAPRLVSALLQAAVAALVVWLAVVTARRITAGLGIGRLADADSDAVALPPSEPAPATVTVLHLQPLPPRLALWHMRSFARRRIHRLRLKKTAA